MAAWVPFPALGGPRNTTREYFGAEVEGEPESRVELAAEVTKDTAVLGKSPAGTPPAADTGSTAG